MKTALDFLPEKRGNAALRHEIYRLRMTRAYNKRVRSRPLKKGDFVLRKMEAVGRSGENGKLTPNWEDPYQRKSGMGLTGWPLWTGRQYQELGTQPTLENITFKVFSL